MEENLDVHLSRVVGWMVRTLGQAISFAAVVTGLLAFIAVGIDEPAMLWFGLCAGPLAGGALLALSNPPMPIDIPEQIDD